MKFAKCIYARFSNSGIDLKLVKGNVFAVTDEIEDSQVFLDGLNTKNFVMVEVRTRPELKAVVNLTEAMEEEFENMLAEKEEAELADAEAEATPDLPPEGPPVETNLEEAKPPLSEDDTTSEDEGDSEEDKAEETKEEEKVLSFTEIAGNVDNALKAISKETDIEKLNNALELDERVTVRKAINARLVELKE